MPNLRKGKGKKNRSRASSISSKDILEKVLFSSKAGDDFSEVRDKKKRAHHDSSQENPFFRASMNSEIGPRSVGDDSETSMPHKTYKMVPK